jgi:cyclic beta-1,2-glucan synthetase
MNQVWTQLVRKDDGLVLLFAPPFHSSALDPGYIKGYLPGIRENGGQYTHAALWVAQAFALQGQADRAWEILEMINPISHSDTAQKIAQYQVEPYVVAADVYGVPPNVGRGGWTWYTGSAAWMYRIILETVLGFELRGNLLKLRPRMPSAWPGFELSYRYQSSLYEITVRRNRSEEHRGTGFNAHVTLDGQRLDTDSITLINDGQTHRVDIEVIE